MPLPRAKPPPCSQTRTGRRLAVESRRPDVQAQAVLAHAVVVPMIDEHRVGLRTAVVETLGTESPKATAGRTPFHGPGRLRRHEAVFSRSRRAVGNAPEIVDSAQDETAHLAVAGRSDGDLFADEELLVIGLGGGRCGRSGMRAASSRKNPCKRSERRFMVKKISVSSPFGINSGESFRS